MKYVVVIVDGMAGQPTEELDNKTPLEVARTPHLDRVSTSGVVGTVRTAPEGIKPNGDVAVMSILGINPAEVYSGRGPLEAAGMGLELGPNEVAFRCNLVTIKDDVMVDFRAGRIRPAEGQALLDALAGRLGSEQITFQVGRGYHHLLVYAGPQDVSSVCTPPHAVVDQPCSKHLPQGPGAEFLRDLMQRSVDVLEPHDINVVRVDHGENPATMMWLWGGGRTPQMPPFGELFRKTGAIVSSAVRVLGIGKHLGLTAVAVEETDEGPNATGVAEAAVREMQTRELVIAHLGRADDVVRDMSPQERVDMLEAADVVLGTVLDALSAEDEYRVLVTTDYVRPASGRPDGAEQVPFAICGARIQPVHQLPLTESSAASTGMTLDVGHELMPYFLRD